MASSSLTKLSVLDLDNIVVALRVFRDRNAGTPTGRRSERLRRRCERILIDRGVYVEAR